MLEITSQKTPMLSVIIPVYNAEKFLLRAVYSVYKHAPEDTEIIIVDDASEGSCQQIVSQLPRVTYISHTVNKGLLAARCTGINAASGDYIVHLDPDDWIINDMYSQGLETIINHDLDVFIFGVEECDSNNKKWIENNNVLSDKLDLQGNDIIERIFLINSAWIWHVGVNKIVKRECWLEALKKIKDLPRINMFEDLLFSILLYTNFPDNRKIGVTKDIGYQYYRHENTLTLSKDNRANFLRVKDIFRVRKLVIEIMGIKWNFLRPFINLKFNNTLKKSTYLMSLNFKFKHPLIYLKSFFYLHYFDLIKNNPEQEMIIFRKIIKYIPFDKKRYYVFGNGALAKRLGVYIIESKLNLKFFIVSTSSDKNLLGFPILGLNNLNRMDQDDVILIGSGGSINSIYALLIEHSKNVNIVSAFGYQKNAAA
ncbi:glycosyltransferase family 2 protein [Flavobacterium sp. W21_SRS_FM6]|uniref:glycosyltransferase family 2 protein n=1 Tax=Flavobacterium sp. W21_SRS_FM6 TaxID=3240268 RepID=UPI003F8FD4BD